MGKEEEFGLDPEEQAGLQKAGGGCCQLQKTFAVLIFLASLCCLPADQEIFKTLSSSALLPGNRCRSLAQLLMVGVQRLGGS